MSRLRHEKGVRAGADSGIHRLAVDKPRPFKAAEERKHGGKVHGEQEHHKLSRKRGGKIHGHHGTDETPDRGMKFGTPLQDGDKMASGGWIKSAIHHPGVEKRAAKRAGVSTHEYMEEHKHDAGKAGARARLGLRLSARAKHKKD